MKELSILIGGKAGFGIDKASSIIGDIMKNLGYYVYIYRDYPSLIRGGHTFSIIRISSQKIYSHRDQVDFVLALNQDTLNFHKHRLKKDSVVIYDSDSVKLDDMPGGMKQGIGIAIGKIIKDENASEIMRNTCIIGCFCKAAGIAWDVLEATFREDVARELELNLKIALSGYNGSKESMKIERLPEKGLPVITGNEAISRGLIKAGLNAYISYPMTPSSGILHYMASVAEKSSLKVIHPENEIAVILMALGFSYAGGKAAVGTSGGGFCLMTEGLSLAAMAELPVLIVMGQRPGPSTGLPTYTSQTELHFVLNAGQGEFSKFVAAPGDLEEAYYWSGIGLNMAWKYQIPAIILSDKTLAEGNYSFDIEAVKEVKDEQPLARVFPPAKGKAIKVNSYEHDENGITTEDPVITKAMQDKRLQKEKALSEELGNYETVKIYGNEGSRSAIVSWGSNKGVAREAAEKMGLKLIHVPVLWPFPLKKFQDAIKGVETLIVIENNATGQFVKLMQLFGLKADKKILKYDGRPFSVDELEQELKKL
ncbi:MAG: 2-oxoacid:acceptor oxidoreductase subunit alpha [Candidatus Omnitrophota bacterium]